MMSSRKSAKPSTSESATSTQTKQSEDKINSASKSSQQLASLGEQYLCSILFICCATISCIHFRPLYVE